MSSEDYGSVISKAARTRNANQVFLSSSMPDQLLIAEVYPPHLLTEGQQAAFAGREDCKHQTAGVLSRELLSAQPGVKLQGGHQNLLTYFSLQSDIKMQQLFPRGSQCCEHGWIFAPQLNPAEATVSYGRGREWIRL